MKMQERESLERNGDSKPFVLFAKGLSVGQKYVQRDCATWHRTKERFLCKHHYPTASETLLHIESLPSLLSQENAAVQFVIAHWLRHSDKLIWGVKKGWERWSYRVCLCSVAP